MNDREEIIDTCIPISMTRRQPNLTLTECLVVLEGPPAWRSDEISHTKALDGAFHIKNRLQELLEASLSVLNTTIGGDSAREDALDDNIRAALELL